MAEYTGKCKYCETGVNGASVCSACKVKLRLVRRLLGMVKDAKAQIVQENTIRAYLKESA